MSWENLATSHKSHLEIAQLGFRNEFDCPVQTSATILSQQVESNQNWKEAMKISHHLSMLQITSTSSTSSRSSKILNKTQT